jgi:hypothetical protein
VEPRSWWGYALVAVASAAAAAALLSLIL